MSNLIRVSTEGGDVVLDPFYRQVLISETLKVKNFHSIENNFYMGKQSSFT